MTHSGVGKVEIGFSEACERNKQVIFAVLADVFRDSSRILEVGSGTGQHAVHFAAGLPDVIWQPTDQQAYLPGLTARLAAEASANVLPAIELDVRMDAWPCTGFDGSFSANTLHYMSTDAVEAFFRGMGNALLSGGVLVVYGPFRYNNAYTSESNARFDQWLHDSDPVRGIRDFEWVTELAKQQQFELIHDVAMPTNNQSLVWVKETSL